MKQKIPAMLATLLVSITFFLATGASHTAEAYWEYRVFTDHLCNTRYISYDSRGNQTGMYYSAGSSHNPTIYISSDGYAGNIGVDGSGWNDSPVTGTIAGKTVTLSTTFHANYRGTLSKWVEPPPPPPG